MGLFPTHFDRRFEKIIKRITVFLAPILGPYFGPLFGCPILHCGPMWLWVPSRQASMLSCASAAASEMGDKEATDHKGKIGPKIGPKIGTNKNGNLFNDFDKSSIKMDRE